MIELGPTNGFGKREEFVSTSQVDPWKRIGSNVLPSYLERCLGFD